MLSPDLIPLLRCPATKQPLRVATPEEKRRHGAPEEESALITQDGTRLYGSPNGLLVLISTTDVGGVG